MEIVKHTGQTSLRETRGGSDSMDFEPFRRDTQTYETVTSLLRIRRHSRYVRTRFVHQVLRVTLIGGRSIEARNDVATQFNGPGHDTRNSIQISIGSSVAIRG